MSILREPPTLLVDIAKLYSVPGVSNLPDRAAGIGRIGAHVVPPSVEYSSLDIVDPFDIPNSAYTTKEVALESMTTISDGRGTPPVDAVTAVDATL